MPNADERSHAGTPPQGGPSRCWNTGLRPGARRTGTRRQRPGVADAAVVLTFVLTLTGASPAAAADSPLSCQRFQDLGAIVDSPEFARLLQWLQGLLSMFGSDSGAGRALTAKDLQKALTLYCARHPDGSITDGIIEYLAPEAPDSDAPDVISVGAPGANAPAGSGCALHQRQRVTTPAPAARQAAAPTLRVPLSARLW